MYQSIPRVNDLKLRGVNDGIMRLAHAQSTYVSRDVEEIAMLFRPNRADSGYPNLEFAITYPRTWGVEQIRMDLFARLAAHEAKHSSRFVS